MPGLAGLNGSTGTFLATIAGVIAIGGTVLNYQSARLDDAREEARSARAELKSDMLDRFARIERTLAEREDKHQQNSRDIVSLQEKNVEIETQFRAASTVNNLERQMDWIVDALRQACPACSLPTRTYYPPGPGPSGTNGQH